MIKSKGFCLVDMKTLGTSFGHSALLGTWYISCMYQAPGEPPWSETLHISSPATRILGTEIV